MLQPMSTYLIFLAFREVYFTVLYNGTANGVRAAILLSAFIRARLSLLVLPSSHLDDFHLRNMAGTP